MNNRRKLGQHFFKARFLCKVLPFLSVNVKDKYVLEIGVGTGNLTKRIAPIVRELTGYEKDRYLYIIARRELKNYKNVKVVYGDALKADPTNYDIVIGNLPFSISSKFIEWMILNDVKRATVVLQKDFIDKLLAKPGDKKYVAISVLAQYFYRVNPILVIPPNWFSPPPKVYSVLTDFIRKGNSRHGDMELIRGVKEVFSMKRKLARKVFGVNELGIKRIYELDPETICKLVQRRRISTRGGLPIST